MKSTTLDRNLKNVLHVILTIVMLASLADAITAATLKATPCSWLNDISTALRAIGPALVTVMFVYGGLKYIFSADDPGGRKQGKTICIQALIGGVIIAMATTIGISAVCT